MGFFSWLFGTNKKKRPKISRDSRAVKRLARRRGVSVHALDLYDDSIIEDLLLLGLILSDDGDYYYDDPHFIEDASADSLGGIAFEAESSGSFTDETETTTSGETSTDSVEDSNTFDTTPEPVEVKPLPDPPPPPVSTYEPPVYDPPADPEPSSSGSSWTENTSPSWGGSFDSGGSSSYDSGGGFDSGGDSGGCD